MFENKINYTFFIQITIQTIKVLKSDKIKYDMYHTVGKLPKRVYGNIWMAFFANF